MNRLIRSATVSALILGALSLGIAGNVEARGGYGHGGHSHFSLSVGIPLGYYGGYGWDAPYYPPYYGPAYYGPAYYPRPVYRPSYRLQGGPIYSLGLFPAHVGDQLTSNDRQVYFTAYRRALAAPVGEGMAWDSGIARGEITTVRDGWAGERYCREFHQDITIGGRSQDAYGTACQMPNGDWQLVQDN